MTEEEQEYECSGYYFEECTINEIRKDINISFEECKFLINYNIENIKYDEFIERFDDLFEENEITEEQTLKMYDLLMQIEKLENYILINEVYKIENISGFNDDHRGSDHFSVKIPYDDSYILNKKTTLKEFIEILYLLKSHKCDKWYELYCNSTFTDGKITIYFDHGS